MVVCAERGRRRSQQGSRRAVCRGGMARGCPARVCGHAEQLTGCQRARLQAGGRRRGAASGRRAPPSALCVALRKRLPEDENLSVNARRVPLKTCQARRARCLAAATACAPVKSTIARAKSSHISVGCVCVNKAHQTMKHCACQETPLSCHHLPERGFGLVHGRPGGPSPLPL